MLLYYSKIEANVANTRGFPWETPLPPIERAGLSAGYF